MRVSLIVTALLAKGFVKENRDHVYFFYHYQGKKTSIFTRFSHGEKDADAWLLKKVAQQIRLTNKEIEAFVEMHPHGTALRRNDD